MDKIETILNNLPEKPYRSRLDPHADLIKELLRRGWTYREIARILLEKCGVHISISTIHHFVRTRSRSKRQLPKFHPQKPEKKTAVPTARKEEERSSPRKDVSDDEVYKRIAALKQRPVSFENATTVFRYDPDEPLNLPQKPDKFESGK